MGDRGTIFLDDYIPKDWLPIPEKDITGFQKIVKKLPKRFVSMGHIKHL